MDRRICPKGLFGITKIAVRCPTVTGGTDLSIYDLHSLQIVFLQDLRW